MPRTPLCRRTSLLIVSLSFNPAGFPAKRFEGMIPARKETMAPLIAGPAVSFREDAAAGSRA